MTEIRFYHLTRNTLEDVLPEMLEKTLERGLRAVVITGSPERAEVLTQHLWNFRPDRFIPHGNAKDGFAESQPVWLTAEDERPNKAEFLFLGDGASSAQIGEYQRVCEIFRGDDENAVATARQRWAAYKDAGHDLSYWQQGDKGWVQKAI